jgi:hypothetical protein
MLDLGLFSDEQFKVIAFQDSCVKCDRESYDNYLKTLDESLLSMAEGAEPTRFVLKKYLTQKESGAVKDNMISFDSNKNVKVNISSSVEEVRRALVGIEAPDAINAIRWKKDSGDQWFDRDLLAKLDQVGIVADLATARASVMGGTNGNMELLKKS